jgi:hypothetical protein
MGRMLRRGPAEQGADRRLAARAEGHACCYCERLSSVRLSSGLFFIRKLNPLGFVPMKRNRRSGYSRRLVRRSLAPIAASILVALAGCKEGGTDPKGPTSITLSPQTLNLSVGQTATLFATVKDENGAPMPSFSALTWSSGNSAIASVAKSDTTGVVTAVTKGQTQISAAVRSNLMAHVTINVQ